MHDEKGTIGAGGGAAAAAAVVAAAVAAIEAGTENNLAELELQRLKVCVGGAVGHVISRVL